MPQPVRPVVLAAMLALGVVACGSSIAATPTPAGATPAPTTASAAPSAAATATPTPTPAASPTPSATATPSAVAAISLTCPSASTVSSDFQTPFTAQPPGAGDVLERNGVPPPGDASVSQCTYTDAAITASIIVVLATGYPASDFDTAEQDITQPAGTTISGSQTFDPQSGLGDQAVDYDFRVATSSGTNYEFGTIAIQGTNLVSVQGWGNTFTPDQSMFDTLISALLT